MPKIPNSTNSPTDKRLFNLRVRRALFDNPDSWYVSNRGNLCRRWDGRIVTVFADSRGQYGWSIQGDDGPEYSPRRYETEAEAREALGSEIVMGDY